MEIKNGSVIRVYDTDCAYEEVIIPDRTMIIGESACKDLEFKKVVLPKSIKRIEDFAFYNTGLEEIIIPEGVEYIGQRAFASCSNLKRVILPKSLKHIGSAAFSDCPNIEEITLPEGIEEINYRMFAGCNRLKKITIPNSVKKIDWAVFSDCTSLEEITLPDSITSLDKQLFMNCKNLKKVKLPKDITELPNEFFKNCKSLNIELPSTIDTLGNGVFSGCTSQDIFPTNVKTFGSDCFKYCHKLKDVQLNEQVSFLPDGMFDDCLNLSTITFKGKKSISIGNRCFRNCKSLTAIPSFIDNLAKGLFEGCESLVDITIADSSIPDSCFRNCTNLRHINGTDKVRSIESNAFSGCINLEEINIDKVKEIKPGTFRDCRSLRKVKLANYVRKIGKEAFLNCYLLEDINLADTIETIDKRAFKHCHSIKRIVIPGNLKRIHDDSFSYMYSLEHIDVSPFNKRLKTPDHLILISEDTQKLILYAMGAKNTSYSLADYCISTYDGGELIRPLTYIGPFAFAGAKNLKELTLCTCVNDIERTVFEGCDNLKKLVIQNLSLYGCQGFKLRNNGKYFFKEFSNQSIDIPFEEVEYRDELVAIMQDALPYFEKVTKIVLPKVGAYSVYEGAFKGCTALREVIVPNNVRNIGKDAFPKGTKITFDNGLELSGLVSLTYNEDYNGKYKLYELEDGTFYIESEEKIIKITKKDIGKMVSHPHDIDSNPVLFLDFYNDLCDHELDEGLLLNGVLMSTMSLDNRKIMFDYLKKDDLFAKDVLENSAIFDSKDSSTTYLLSESNFKIVISFIKLLRLHKIFDKELYHKFFMRFLTEKGFERLLELDRSQLLFVLNNSGLFNVKNEELLIEIFKERRIEKFIDLITRYNIKSSVIINPYFISIANHPLFEKMLSVYNANIRRVILESCILDNPTTARQNLIDLLNLLYITGALENDSKLNQRAATFITEKMFHQKLPNEKNNKFRVIGDDIHRIFNFRELRDEFDLEFANFYLENYQELIENERIKAGFIERVYINFREISRTCTSDKGSQRKLKVTMDKCIGYLSNVKFDGVNKNNRELADLIGNWYDKNDVWINAQKVYKESLSAPRNIFAPIEYDEDGVPIYDMSPKLDLREEISEDFSYEWLPKQAIENLVLGKYCNCCAHMNGAGQGIMRASMIHDSVQNLVIRNGLGEIIAKSTLYVNRDKGYAVFNNVESSLNFRAESDLKKIYKAFMRGARAFIKAYNKNNKIKITDMTIGASRNTILSYLTDDEHPVTDIHQSLEFGSYSLGGYHYAGDWKSSQRLVLKGKKV